MHHWPSTRHGKCCVRDNGRLKIGYLMQADSTDMAVTSGPQLHVKAAVEGFRRRGHRVRIVAIQQGKPVWSDGLELWCDCTFIFSKSPVFRAVEKPIRRVQTILGLPHLRLFDSYRFSDACVSALAGYDALYERFGFLSYGGLIAARRLGIPIVYEVNGDLVEEFAVNRVPISMTQWRVIHGVTKQMFNRADHVVAVSETLKQGILERWGIPDTKVSVVPNGVDLDVIQGVSQEDASRARARTGGARSVIFVGGFQPWHGIDLLVEAFALVAAQDSDAVLVLVGDGPVRVQLEQRVAGLGLNGRVVFTGRVAHEEVAALLAASCIAVLNPRENAMTRSQSPLKLFEYMAAGKAIVAPATPELRPFLTDRRNALLVSPGNREALAEALVELLRDSGLRSTLGDAAREQAKSRHSWDVTVGTLETILETAGRDRGTARAQAINV